MTGAKVALLRWQNSKGVHARVCVITERAVKKNRPMHYQKSRWRCKVRKYLGWN